MSTNRAVTVFRSPPVIGEGSDCSAATRIPPGDSGDGEVAIIELASVSGFPHLPQKFAACGFSALHLPHNDVSVFPHWMQKLLPGGLVVPHLEQRIGLPELAKRRFIYHLTAGGHKQHPHV